MINEGLKKLLQNKLGAIQSISLIEKGFSNEELRQNKSGSRLSSAR